MKKHSRKTYKKKKNIKQRGGNKWGSWEGASTMNNPFASLFYNRFVRAPYISEMAEISPYEQ